jgi:DNA adenine methylase
LRYPGGKGRLARFVQCVLAKNKLLDGKYVEPYAGGAAVAMSLLMLEYVSSIYLNDISKPVYSFWKAVLTETDALCKKIYDKKVTVNQWEKQRHVQKQLSQHSQLEVAYSTFFLNRTNRSGIIDGGGMIGGSNQKGKWKLDARYNKQELIRRIETIAIYSNRIQVFNQDAERFLKAIMPSLPINTLIFLDPPYFEKGHRLYENHYTPADHARVAKVVRNELSRRWIISYDDHPQIRTAYRGCKRMIYTLPYSAAKRHEGSEVMFFSPDVAMPAVANPLSC